MATLYYSFTFTHLRRMESSMDDLFIFENATDGEFFALKVSGTKMTVAGKEMDVLKCVADDMSLTALIEQIRKMDKKEEENDLKDDI